MAEPNATNGSGASSARSGSARDLEGQSAILLVESLLHGLVARSVISVADAIEIVDAAIEVEEERIFDGEADVDLTHRSLSVLGSMRLSLAHDLPRD